MLQYLNFLNRDRLNLFFLAVHIIVLGHLWLNFREYKEATLQGYHFFFAEGETGSYYEPIIRLADTGEYSWRTSTDRYGSESIEPSTRRTPGLLPFFYPVYKISGDEKAAKDVVIIIQLLLFLLSVFALARSAELIFQTPLAYYGTHVLAALFWFNHPFVFLGIPESPANSMLIFSLFFFLRVVREQKVNQSLWLLALTGSWAIMLRPALIIWIFSLGIVVVLALLTSRWSLRRTLHIFMIGFVPIGLVMGLWVTRNYSINGTLAPEDSVFESSPAVYTPCTKAIYQLIGTWGGVVQHWVPGTEGSWFFASEETNPLKPHYHFGSYDQEWFSEIRTLYRESQEKSTSRERLDEIDQTVQTSIDGYIEEYAARYPFRYHVLNRMRAITIFIHLKTYSYLPYPAAAQMNILQLAIRSFQVVIVYLLYLIAAAGVMLTIYSREQLIFTLVPILFTILYILLLGGFLRAIEPRYLVPVFPFLMVSGQPVFTWIVKKITSN